jgi:hypothetical protein
MRAGERPLSTADRVVYAVWVLLTLFWLCLEAK